MRVCKSYELASCCLCHEVVSHALAEYRLAASKNILEDLYCLFTVACASGAVGHVYTVILESCEVIVKWNTDHFSSSCEQAADDAVLHAEVNDNHLLAVCRRRLASVDILNVLSLFCLVDNHFLAAHVCWGWFGCFHWL